MAEEGQAEAAGATTTTGATMTTDTTVAATTDVPESFINEDGTLAEGWRDKYVPEDLRKEKVYDTIKDLPTAFKTLGHQAKLVGRKGILLPTETSGQSEWDAFHEALGRPKTAEEYVLEVPEEHADYFDEELIKEARSMFHGQGFNQKQVDILWEFEKKRVAQMDKMLDDFEEQEKTEAETTLRNKWGTAYDENIHLGNRMISENAAEGEERDYLIAEYGNSPRLANFLANIAKKFVEHKIITDVETPSADIESKISELMNSPAYKDPEFTDRAEHKRVVAQVYALREQLVKMKKMG